MRIEEFEAEKAWWGGVDRSNRVENEYAWKVSAADIKARNYNLDIKNPHSPDAGQPRPGRTARRLRRPAAADQPDPRPAQGRPRRRAGGQGVSVVLSEHLPLLATAPDGIQKLRGLILELAVRGKLVPQDPNDEPASELLKRIAKERARLEAEGICRKSKPLQPVGEDEQPFALPEGWDVGSLAAIGRLGRERNAALAILATTRIDSVVKSGELIADSSDARNCHRLGAERMRHCVNRTIMY